MTPSTDNCASLRHCLKRKAIDLEGPSLPLVDCDWKAESCTARLAFCQLFRKCRYGRGRSSETGEVDPIGWAPIGLNKVVGLAARETPKGLARPLQLFNFLMY